MPVSAVDLEPAKSSKSNGNKTSQPPQTQQSLPPPLPVRATKKEIMEGTKSMEQQNINLAQYKSLQAPQTQDIEWNVIKKGKKVKVVKNEIEEHQTPIPKKDTSPEVVKEKVQDSINSEVVVKKTTAILPVGTAKPSVKKPKGKNKKKKSQHLMTKQQDGFEIIEPQFGTSSKSDENIAESGEEETFLDDTLEEDTTEITIASENIVEKMELLIVNDDDDDNKPTENVEIEAKTEVILKKLNNLEDDGAVIDISDEEICRKTLIELDLAEIAQEIIENDKSVEAQEESVCSIAISQQLSEALKDLEVSVDDSELRLQMESNESLKAASFNSNQSMESEIFSENISLPSIQAQELNLPIELENIDSCPSAPTTPTFDDINFFGDHKNIAELERDLIENLRNMDDGIDIKSPLINPLYDFPITAAVSKWLQEKKHESFDHLFHVQNFKKLSELYDECDDESDISESPNKSETTDSDYGSDCQVKANGSPTSSKSAASIKKQAVKGTSNKLKIVKESFCALM